VRCPGHDVVVLEDTVITTFQTSRVEQLKTDLSIDRGHE